jgi:hypothetical protein
MQQMNDIAVALQKIHLKKLSHGNISLENMFLKQNGKIVIGPPYYHQISKYANRYHPVASSSLSGFAKDIWNLGLLYLQIITKTQIHNNH